MKKKILIIVCFCASFMLHAAVLKTVTVTAGGLSAALTATEEASVTDLTVTGSIDARDIKFMRDGIPNLAVLNLSGASIKAYTGTAGTDLLITSYLANAMPNFSFSNSNDYSGKPTLKTVILPNTIISIDKGAFLGCESLTSMTLPSSITTIGSYAFNGCIRLTSIIIPANVTSIGQFAFGNCAGLSSITIPNSIKSIEEGTLSNCPKLTNIAIPTSVTSIGSFAFYECTGLSNVTIPNSVIKIGESAFDNCSGITALKISNSVISIENNTFSNCSGLTSIIIPNSVTTIMDWAFYNCSKLLNVSIGDAITTIGEYAFGNCNVLSKINMTKVQPVALTSNVFNSINFSSCTLTVPVNSKSTYQAASIWKNFLNIVEYSSQYNQKIALVSGWNIISSNVIPSDINLKNILQPLINKGKLIKVMDESGKAIENFAALGGWNNGIGNFSQTEGYRVNLSSEDTLVLNGSAVVLPLKIPLSAGWNIISYPCTNAQSAQTVVQTLINNGNLIKVMDESGKSVENYGTFGGWKNNIGSFTPGKGFKIYMAKSDSLLITSSILRSAEELASITNLESAYFTKVYEGNGTDHMNINLVNLGTSTLQLGDEIGIFDGKACVGSATIGADQMTQGSISIPTSCNEGVGDIVNGFIPGNAITYKLYSKGILYNMSLTNLSGSATFEKSGSLFVKFESKEISVNIPTDISETKVPVEINCYPNPFVEEITIDIQNTLSKKLNVGIYNLMGQLIKIVFEGEADNIQLKWDGTDKKGNQVIPGIYVCKVNDSSMKIVFTGSK